MPSGSLTRSYVRGLCSLALLVLVWSLSGFLISWLEQGYDFGHGLFKTYVGTGLYVLAFAPWLLGRLVKRRRAGGDPESQGAVDV